MIQNIWRIVVCLSLLLLVSATAQDKSTEVQVEEVLARVQSRSGQTVEWLVDLGQPAVPAICQRLKTYRHPMVIVDALTKLGDPRATEPLIELLDTLKPLSGDANYTARCIRVINALKEIGDLRAEKRLVDIMAGELAYMRVRLSAAGALARFGSPSVKEQARTFIMSAYAERSKYIRSSLDHDFLPQDIYVALCEAGTDEALDIVLNVLRADAMPYQKRAILKYLPKREDEKIVATLLEVSANEGDEVNLRLKALDILMTFESKVSTAALRNRLDDLEQNDLIHEIPEFKRQFNALIKQLSQREQRKEKPQELRIHKLENDIPSTVTTKKKEPDEPLSMPAKQTGKQAVQPEPAQVGRLAIWLVFTAMAIGILLVGLILLLKKKAISRGK